MYKTVLDICMLMVDATGKSSRSYDSLENEIHSD